MAPDMVKASAGKRSIHDGVENTLSPAPPVEKKSQHRGTVKSDATTRRALNLSTAPAAIDKIPQPEIEPEPLPAPVVGSIVILVMPTFDAEVTIQSVFVDADGDICVSFTYNKKEWKTWNKPIPERKWSPVCFRTRL